ncbi:MAG: hypothetical protein AB7E85_08230 [Pseudobdellovibrionaceae bacterium]
MKSSVLLIPTFLAAAYLVPKAANVAEAAIQQGGGATIYELLDTARLPTHIHDSPDVACEFDVQSHEIRLENATTGEVKLLSASEVFPHHYRADFDADNAVHVIEEDHLFAGPRCYGQKNMPVLPLALQIRF